MTKDGDDEDEGCPECKKRQALSLRAREALTELGYCGIADALGLPEAKEGEGE